MKPVAFRPLKAFDNPILRCNMGQHRKREESSILPSFLPFFLVHPAL